MHMVKTTQSTGAAIAGVETPAKSTEDVKSTQSGNGAVGARKGSQGELVSTQERAIPEIELAIADLVDINEEFASVSRKKKAATETLRKALKSNNMERYKRGEWEGWLEPQDDAVKVKRTGGEGE